MKSAATFQAGRIKLILVTGVVATTPIVVRPPLGFIWEIGDCYGWHDDPAPRNCHWSYFDGTNRITRVGNGHGANVAVTLQMHDSANDMPSIVGPLRISHDAYIEWNVALIAAGQYGYVGLMVTEYAE